MDSIQNWRGKLNVPDALRRSHDDLRAELLRATTEGSRIAKARSHLAKLCLPHFEHEEVSIFPVLALLPYLEQGNVRPEMLAVMPHVHDFRATHDETNYHHQSILAAIEELRHAARKEKSRRFVELAHNLRLHENIENEVIYPTVSLIQVRPAPTAFRDQNRHTASMRRTSSWRSMRA